MLHFIFKVTHCYALRELVYCGFGHVVRQNISELKWKENKRKNLKT